jgi:muconate cycloisomerase
LKITRIETIPIQVPIQPALAIRSGRGGSHLASPFLLVKVQTDEGIIGLGEVSCTPRWSGEDQVTAAHFINNYLERVLKMRFHHARRRTMRRIMEIRIMASL